LIEIGSKTLSKTLHKQTNKQTDRQTDRQTNRHYENNGHLAVNQQKRVNFKVRWQNTVSSKQVSL